MIRKTIFWIHLVAGVLTGIVVFSMSLTGVLLTYERQMLHMAEKQQYVPKAQQTTPLALDELAGIAALSAGNQTGNMIIENDAGAPVTFRSGRSGGLQLNPYTGEEMDIDVSGMESFFRTMTSFHRWFSLEGESRNTARAITGASNLAFLFLVVSGIYLWLPPMYKWVMFRGRLLFSSKAMSGKARDFNWHHVFGIWSAIPLAVVVATATVFSYGWANNLVYRAFGEEPPVRGRRGGGPGPGGQMGDQPAQPAVTGALSLEQLVERAIGHSEEGWRELSITLPAASDSQLEVSVDYGNGAQPQLRETLSLDRRSGDVVARSDFSSQSPGQRARSVVRYLHTGEVLGFWGQTVAGLVSFTSLFMVWTGLALAWRRLITPLFKRKAKASSA